MGSQETELNTNTFDLDDENETYLIGQVAEVDTRKVNLEVDSDEKLRKTGVGDLVALRLSGGADAWLIGIVNRLIKSRSQGEEIRDEVEDGESDGTEDGNGDYDRAINTISLSLVGCVVWNAGKKHHLFSRSLSRIPEIGTPCFVLKDRNLESFMGVLARTGSKQSAFELGIYALDGKAKASLDGDKFFQRHAALLGSTGSGKSWTVASILEKAAKLPSGNLIVFDLHGEYKSLSYAKQFRIPGPDDLKSQSEECLFLPYWLLTSDELQSLFIDRSEFTAQNQAMVIQRAVANQKRDTLQALGKTDLLESFTIDSPIPFSLHNVIDEIEGLNSEMVQGARGLKQGPFYGQFNRFLSRMENRISDKRYGFLFQTPDEEHHYEAMVRLASRLMDYTNKASHIKIIDFSEVPTEILPVIVGLVARIVYQIQFWTNAEKRHPLALVCDEAHLYLPKKDGKNPVEIRAIEAFERIAKEGRKYAVSLFIISQRPSDVSTTVLSQCNNVIALRLTNAEDQTTVKKLMPESLESLLDILPTMDVGEAMVVGDAVLLPSRIKVTPPTEEPLSATVNFWSEWSKAPEPPDFHEAVENMRRQGRRKR